MVSDILDPLIRTTLQLINRFGGPATAVVDNGDTSYDPATSSTGTAESQYPIRLLAQDYIQKASGISAQAGGLIQTGDKQFFILPNGAPKLRPEVDYILFEGFRWTVKVFKDHNPSGAKSYMYEVFARR
jgi:hypothetical protein